MVFTIKIIYLCVIYLCKTNIYTHLCILRIQLIKRPSWRSATASKCKPDDCEFESHSGNQLLSSPCSGNKQQNAAQYFKLGKPVLEFLNTKFPSAYSVIYGIWCEAKIKELIKAYTPEATLAFCGYRFYLIRLINYKC